MKHASGPHGNQPLQRLHQLRRVVSWIVLVLLGLVLASVVAAATRDGAAQGPLSASEPSAVSMCPTGSHPMGSARSPATPSATGARRADPESEKS
jgi:hypothetical protein